MKSQDIAISFVQFTNSNNGKIRPLLLIQVKGEQVLAYKITSKYKNKSDKVKEKYYPIQNWKEAGLLKASYIDTYSPPAFIPLSEIKRVIGTLQPIDVLGFENFLLKQNMDY